MYAGCSACVLATEFLCLSCRHRESCEIFDPGNRSLRLKDGIVLAGWSRARGRPKSD